MQLGYREAEDMLGAKYGIHSTRRVAFRGRLDHLRKYGCPDGVNTGKGRPAVFGWNQITELALALELVNLGIPPEQTARALQADKLKLHQTMLELTTRLDAQALVAVAETETWPLVSTTFLSVYIGALSGLTEDGSVHEPIVNSIEGADLSEWFDQRSEVHSAVVLVDLGRTIAKLISHVSIWSGRPINEVVDELAVWAAEECDKILTAITDDLSS